MVFTADIADTSYINESSETHRRITGIEVKLTRTLAGGGRHLIVLAERIFLVENLRLPSLDVRLVAKEVVAPDECTIDVSGDNGRGPLPKPANTKGPSGDGDNGAHGDHGGDAGNIHIVCRKISGTVKLFANGGHGGDGQDGGDGNNGIQGANGGDDSVAGPTSPKGSAGQNGGKGGNAGRGGQGGFGGNAGKILLNVAESPDGPITISAQGGRAGRPGRNGKPGTPGNGGTGGWQRACRQLPNR